MFSVYDSMTCSNFIEVCKYHHVAVLEHFHHLEKIPRALPQLPSNFKEQHTVQLNNLALRTEGIKALCQML